MHAGDVLLCCTVTLKEVLYKHKVGNEMMSGVTKAFNEEERVNGDLIMLLRKTYL